MAFAAIVTAASVGLQVVSAFAEAKSASDRAHYQAAVARNNQIIAQQDAEAIRERARIEEDDHRQRIRQSIGAARARQAASGFVVDQDENLDLLGDLRLAGETDILRMRDDAELRARRFDIEGYNAGVQSQLYADSAPNPFLAAGTTLLSEAASNYGTFSNAFSDVGSSSLPPPGQDPGFRRLSRRAV